MINVDLTIVGFFDEINHVRLAVPGNQPTVKYVLEAMRSHDIRRGIFTFAEEPDMSRKGLYQFFTKEGNSVVSMRYRGYKLTGARTSHSVGEERAWRFSVLRRAGDRSVLMQNSKNLPYDHFRVEDGDQIFWSLVTSLKAPISMSIENDEFEQDALIAV